MDEKIIKLSRFKLVILIVLSFLFVLLGLHTLQINPTGRNLPAFLNSPVFVIGVGCLSILFFGFCLLYGIKKFFDSGVGFILNSSGVSDNSHACSIGFVPWADIAGFEKHELLGQKFIVVKLRDPEKYIETGSKGRRALNRINYEMCGSPVTITANSLRINFAELLNICNNYFWKYANHNQENTIFFENQ